MAYGIVFAMVWWAGPPFPHTIAAGVVALGSAVAMYRMRAVYRLILRRA